MAAMSERDFYDCLVVVEAPAGELSSFASRHLHGGCFSFNSLDPMPPELDFELNNFVEDGFDALFGNWRDLTGRWMFKVHAQQRGYPFPLESRDQVLECITALGEFGAKRFQLGRLFKANLDRFGHGHCSSWREEHWGTAFDADDVIAEIAEPVRLSFSTYGAPPKKVLTGYSRLHPALAFVVTSINEWGKRPSKVRYLAGRPQKLATVTASEACAEIYDFRRRAGLNWLLHRLPGAAPYVADLEMGKRGRPMLKGADIALDFALGRLRQGESAEELAQRFDAITQRHTALLRGLFAVAQ